MIFLLLALAGPAQAQDSDPSPASLASEPIPEELPAEEQPEEEDWARPVEPFGIDPVPGSPDSVSEVHDGTKWAGIVLPFVSYNSTDGLAVGVGGELFQRRIGGGSYIRMLSFQLRFATNGTMQSHQIRYDTRTGGHDILAVVGFRKWTNMRYAGFGAEEVITEWEDLELGNSSISPYAGFGVTHPLKKGFLYAQIYGRYGTMTPAEGNLLDQQKPLGYSDAFYSDLQLGYLVENVDRWPMPSDGWRLDVDTRLGGTWTLDASGMFPSLSFHGEVMGWRSLGPRFVLSGRLFLAQTFGDRPFWEAEFIGGRRRIEMGNEKAFSGYGRTRTRSTGSTAAIVNMRFFVARTNHKFFDIALYLEAFAEDGFLLAEDGLGPHMPSIGGGPTLLWQGGTQLRPFVSFGWRSDIGSTDRYPDMQFGLALEDNL